MLLCDACAPTRATESPCPLAHWLAHGPASLSVQFSVCKHALTLAACVWQNPTGGKQRAVAAEAFFLDYRKVRADELCSSLAQTWQCFAVVRSLTES